jgi:hypothetical protein
MALDDLEKLKQDLNAAVERILRDFNTKLLSITSVNPSQADTSAVPAGFSPKYKTLPWFKHGIKHFINKLWHGDHPSNPSWQGVQRTESRLTLEDYSYIKKSITCYCEQWFNDSGLLYEAVDNPFVGLLGQLSGDLTRTIADGFARAYALGVHHSETPDATTPETKPEVPPSAEVKPEPIAAAPTEPPASPPAPEAPADPAVPAVPDLSTLKSRGRRSKISDSLLGAKKDIAKKTKAIEPTPDVPPSAITPAPETPKAPEVPAPTADALSTPEDSSERLLNRMTHILKTGEASGGVDVDAVRKTLKASGIVLGPRNRVTDVPSAEKLVNLVRELGKKHIGGFEKASWKDLDSYNDLLPQIKIDSHALRQAYQTVESERIQKQRERLASMPDEDRPDWLKEPGDVAPTSVAKEHNIYTLKDRIRSLQESL